MREMTASALRLFSEMSSLEGRSSCTQHVYVWAGRVDGIYRDVVDAVCPLRVQHVYVWDERVGGCLT